MTLRIPEEIYNGLVERAKVDRRSVNAQVVHVVALYLKAKGEPTEKPSLMAPQRAEPAPAANPVGGSWLQDLGRLRQFREMRNRDPNSEAEWETFKRKGY
jgi:hypothetical protein